MEPTANTLFNSWALNSSPSTSSNPSVKKESSHLEDLKKAVKEDNPIKAVQELLHCLVIIDIITDQERAAIYTFLCDFMPFFTDDDFYVLTKNLERLFKHTDFLFIEQRQLAVKLAERYLQKIGQLIECEKLKKTNKDLKAWSTFITDKCLVLYNDAMDYFAKAIQIEEKKGNEKELEKLDYAASLIFLKLLDEYQLQNKSLMENLSKARRDNDLLKFESYLSQIVKILQSFCFENNQALFSEIREQLLEFAKGFVEERHEPFRQSYLKFFQKYNEGLPLAKKYATQKYREGLKELRDYFEKGCADAVNTFGDSKSLMNFQNTATQKFKDFFTLLLNDAEVIAGPPPCEFDVRAMGSIGAKMICSRSDLEPVIFIGKDNPEVISYFMRFVKILELQILSLGETKTVKPVFTCIHTKNPSGFHFDKAGDSLIRTPESMATPIIVEDNLPKIFPNSIQNTVLKTISLNMEASPLFERFQKSVREVLETKIGGLTRRKIRALKLFYARLQDYEKEWEQPFKNVHEPIDVKEKFVSLLSYLLYDMALYWGIEKNNPFDIIDALVEKNIIRENCGELLKEAVTTIHAIRLKMHDYYGQQLEVGVLQASNALPLVISQNNHGEKPPYEFKAHTKDLKRIYWTVLNRLYYYLKSSLVMQQGEFGDNNNVNIEPRLDLEKSVDEFEKTFTTFDLIQEIFIEGALHNPSIVSEVIFSAASYLNKINASDEEHQKNYEVLSGRSDIEPLRRAYLEAVEPRLEKKLSPIPNRAEVSQFLLQQDRKLEEAILGMTTEKAPNLPENQIVKVVLPFSKLERYLQPEVVRKILDDKGNIRSAYSHSMHPVAKATFKGYNLHFKQGPLHPLMEYAIHKFTTSIAGEMLTPPNVLVRFEIGKNHYPVLISQTMGDTTLHDAFSNNEKEALEKINPIRLNWLRLCAILISPGDGRFVNYTLKGNEIYCADNDISFVEPVIEVKKEGFFSMSEKKINFCCALFCFSNSPIEDSIIKRFTALEINLIMDHWMDDLIEQEKRYVALFPKEEDRLRWLNDSKASFTPNILFREGTLANLNIQFIRLQRLLKEEKGIKAFDLLKQLVSISKFDFKAAEPTGVHVFREYEKSCSLKMGTLKKLGRAISRPDHSLTSLQSYLACYGQIPTLEDIEKKQLFSPSRAKNELFCTLLDFSDDYVKIKNTNGRASIQANFQKLVLGFNPDKLEQDKPKTKEVYPRQFSEPDRSRQELVLKAMTMEMKVQKNEKPVSVTLQHCAVLNSVTLEPFLHPQLEELDLRYCQNINDKDIYTIQRKCPQLKQLYISGCKNITLIEINFPSLILLDVRDCDQLKEIKITNAKFARPSSSFIAKNNIALKQVTFANNVRLPNFMSFKKCPYIDLKIRNNVFIKKINNTIQINLKGLFDNEEYETFLMILPHLIDIDEKATSLEIEGEKHLDSRIWEVFLHERIESLTINAPIEINDELVRIIHALGPRLSELNLSRCKGNILLIKHNMLTNINITKCEFKSLSVKTPLLKEIKVDGISQPFKNVTVLNSR